MKLPRHAFTVRTSQSIGLLKTIRIVTTPITSYSLTPTTFRELQLKRLHHPQLEALPTTFALSLTGDIELWPTPDQDYELAITFYPMPVTE